MCEFCVKHGEGKIWYLQAKNYSLDLLSDLRRRKWIEKFLVNIESDMAKLAVLDRLRQKVTEISEIREDEARDSAEALLWKLEQEVKRLGEYDRQSDEYWTLFEDIQNGILRAEAIINKFGITDLEGRVKRLMTILGQ